MGNCGQTQTLSEGKREWLAQAAIPQRSRCLKVFSQTGNFASPPHDGYALKQIMDIKKLMVDSRYRHLAGKLLCKKLHQITLTIIPECTPNGNQDLGKTPIEQAQIERVLNQHHPLGGKGHRWATRRRDGFKKARKKN